jgi:signal transduction histidine kinase/putative methionine-R-sulfoxide reductase with GAF domain
MSEKLETQPEHIRLRDRLMRLFSASSITWRDAFILILVACGYMLLVSGILLILGGEMLARNPWLFGLIIFVTALAFFPLFSSISHGINSRLARRQSVRPEHHQSLIRELMHTTDQNKILRILQGSIRDNLAPTHLHIFTFDPLTNSYVAAPDFSTVPVQTTSDLRFQTSSTLVQLLSGRHEPIFLGEPETQPVTLKPDQARIALLGTPLFVPLLGRQQLLGWAALGAPSNQDAYQKQDLEFLESLCEQAALALERSQIVADLEYRVHTLNVLTRVSQGINITLSFDDTLELIYTQTNYVLPTQDLNISLYDRQSDHLYPVFYLEKDERLAEHENQPVPLDQGLEHDVLNARRGLIADDYEHECRSRGKLPAGEGLVSWIGVPLNTGAETIGVLSIANRDPSVFYTQEQADLLQAIADQAAGAIVKARLLQDAERRTRQLTSLNEVARSLTSTLDLDPLLNQILTNAADILDCEAGSLLLLDQETGELVFEVTVGPVANDILGKRLPPGVGLAGRSVELRQAIIQNDAHRSKEWSSDIDNETGFITRDIQVVPMLVKDQCLGAIEVINRRDGLPFTQADQELLMAYASQAGVALENARLYTQTDQTLAARVDELSVMQRIDRELNASLDVARAMRITLDWAMRQSKADAGLVGIIQSDGILIMANQGYTAELDAYPHQVLPAGMASIQKSIDSGQPEILLLSGQADEQNDQNTILLNAGLAQAVIPITREVAVIGVIILESVNPIAYPAEIMSFLSRLSDHAAIAISNAQLYAAVQAANLAKSEFVSFVSHELKTPMTSIRGFTDLLAAGVVGQVNEAQGNFLTTIRSNVDRMATLVSDLADVSRIEANRLRLDFQAVDLVELIDEINRSSHTQIASKDQVLELDIPSNLPSLWGDRTRLIQVLTNLVNNAHKYTPPGGTIHVSAQFTQNQWDADGSPMVVHISVQDNGIGINPEDQKKIFQKFFRADDQKVRDIAGTGLGLNITKTLVEMQGGKIWFESAPDQGTTFHFTVPTVENA